MNYKDIPIQERVIYKIVVIEINHDRTSMVFKLYDTGRRFETNFPKRSEWNKVQENDILNIHLEIYYGNGHNSHIQYGKLVIDELTREKTFLSVNTTQSQYAEIAAWL
jgi:hypothetical protein